MKKGFSLLEILLSVTILSILAASVFPMVGWLLSKSTEYKYDTEAAEVLQEGMEAVYNVMLASSDWSTLTSGSTWHVSQVPDAGDSNLFSWTIDTGSVVVDERFTRWFVVSDVCRNPTNGKMTNCSGSAIPDDRSKTISTYVTWSEPSGTKSVKADLLITRL